MVRFSIVTPHISIGESMREGEGTERGREREIFLSLREHSAPCRFFFSSLADLKTEGRGKARRAGRALATVELGSP